MVERWNWLVGKKTEVKLESRIFHSVCLMSLFGIGINIPFNYLIGLTDGSLLMFFIFIVVLFIYYTSRFRNKANLAISIFLIFNNFLIVANYYYNSGINGPSHLIFILSFFVSVAIIPQKLYRIWLPVNAILALSLLFIEATHPGIIANTYPNQTSRFIDFAYTYVVTIAFLLLVTVYIRNAYNQERQKVEKEAEALEISNNTKNKLLSILAHDLKEPLSSIQGFLELLTEYNLEEAERIHIEKELLKRTHDTTFLLTNVLSWTKRQMEFVSVKLTPLGLLQTLDSTLQILKSIAKEKAIELEYELTDDVCIIGDRDMLQLVIRNLITNAVKFTHSGGKITVYSVVADGVCVIGVKDTGVGIPLSQQATLFSLSAGSTFGTGNEKGAGLGLVLCREFMELQEGKIWCTSKPNEGTTFFISLAICTPEQNQAFMLATS